jgi:hypothetical protein
VVANKSSVANPNLFSFANFVVWQRWFAANKLANASSANLKFFAVG